MNLNRYDFDETTIEHLNEEIPETMNELAELDQLMEETARSLSSNLDKVNKHRQRCGVCLSRQIAEGSLITIEEFWSIPD